MLKGVYDGSIVNPWYICLDVFGGYIDFLRMTISMMLNFDTGMSFLSGYTSI